jgi:hypothetical protein
MWHTVDMTIRYQTGVTTLAQFVSMAILNLINMLYSSIHSCVKSGSECVGDVTLNLLYFLVVCAWFGFIWVMGYAAQDRRSKRIAQALIAAEIAVLLAALLDLKHYPNALGLITSAVDAFFAGWTILLAYRLIKSGGGRVVSQSHPRKRRKS